MRRRAFLHVAAGGIDAGVARPAWSAPKKRRFVLRADPGRYTVAGMTIRFVHRKGPSHEVTDQGIYIPSNYDAFTPPATEGGSYIDAAFGKRITRLSVVGNNSPSTSISNEYASPAATNCDNTLVFLSGWGGGTRFFSATGGLATGILYSDPTAYTGLSGGLSQARWSHTEPLRIYYVEPQVEYYRGADSSGTAAIKSIHLGTGTITTHRTTTYANLYPATGDLSPDGDYWALMANGRYVFWYRFSDDTIGPIVNLSTVLGAFPGDKGGVSIQGNRFTKFNYPSASTADKTVSNTGIIASTSASPIVIQHDGQRPPPNGQTVRINAHLVNTNANGNWVVTTVDGTHFSLNGSTGTGTAGGATGVALWHADGDVTSTYKYAFGCVVFDRDTMAIVSTVFQTNETAGLIKQLNHNDFGVDVDGAAIMVTADSGYQYCQGHPLYIPGSGGVVPIVKWNLNTGTVTNLGCFPERLAGGGDGTHSTVSDFYVSLPATYTGWVLYDTVNVAGQYNAGTNTWDYGAPTPYAWQPFEQEMWLVKLDGSGAVRRLAHHRTKSAITTWTPWTLTYGGYPKPTLSIDGTTLVFGSNMGLVNPTPSGDVEYTDAYLLEI